MIKQALVLLLVYIAHSQLWCSTGYTLINRKCVPVCYDVAATDATVCSNHGRCIAPSQCDCVNQWKGDNCNILSCDEGYSLVNGTCIPICFGVLGSNTKLICSGKGNCIAPDSCRCNAGFIGESCQTLSCTSGYANWNNSCIPICFGMIERACSEHGECIAPNQCSCREGYTGLQCDVAVNKCASNLRWNGTACEHACFGIFASDRRVCSGNGRCISNDLCECKANRTGPQCSTIVITNPNTTTNSTTRKCAAGYSEFNGECFATCYGVPSYNTSVCSGNGNCSAPNSCQCQQPYKNFNCDSICPTNYTLIENTTTCIPICFGKAGPQACSQHGVCTSPSECTCDYGFVGAECNSTLCQANFVFDGTKCIPLCFGIPANESASCNGMGTCVDPDRCDCHVGFAGPNCTITVDPTCAAGYVLNGNRCVPTCFGIPATNNSIVCSGKGICYSVDKCNCTLNNTGQQCEQLITCFGIAITNESVCSSHGICTIFGQCVCHAGFLGPECAIKNSSCPIGFTSDDCKTPICFGYPATHTKVCGGRGICAAPDTCACLSGLTGANCTANNALENGTAKQYHVNAYVSIGISLITICLLLM